MNMGKPQNNGLVEFVDDKQGMDGSWNCMDFHLFAFREKNKSWEAAHARFLLPNQGTARIKTFAPDMPVQWQKGSSDRSSQNCFEPCRKKVSTISYR